MKYLTKFTKKLTHCPVGLILQVTILGLILLPFGDSLLSQPKGEKQPVSLAKIASGLEQQLPAQLRNHRVAGVQIAIFDQSQSRIVQAGMYAPGDTSTLKKAETSKALPVSEQTYFEIGYFNRPMIAVAILENLARHTNLSYAEVAQLKLKDLDEALLFGLWQARPQAAAQKESLLNMRLIDIINHTSGLPLSRPRMRLVAPGTDARQVQPLLFEARDYLPVEDSQTTIRQSAAGYDLLLSLLHARLTTRPSGIPEQFQKSKLNCARNPGCELARPMVRAADQVFWMDHQDGYLPESGSMLGQASDIAKYLRNFMKRSRARGSAEELLFSNAFRYHKNLGGVVAGQHLMRLHSGHKETVTGFALESRRPGQSAIAFVAQDGRGVVVLGNTENIGMLYLLMHGVFQRWGWMPGELAASMPAVTPERPSILGSYRPRGIIPQDQKYLSFLSDMTLFEVRGRLEMQSVFQKKTGSFLYPLPDKPDQFIMYGPAPSHGWRLHVIRDEDGDAVALESDLLRYERVSRLASGWIVIVYLALVFMSLMALGFYLLWRRLPSRE